MKNKYIFFKRLYKDYVIIIESKGQLQSMGYDKQLIKYINNKDINYIIVHNDFSLEKIVCKKNNYKKYLIKQFLEEICLF